MPLISSVTLLPPLYELLSLPQRLLWRQNHITCGNRTGAIWLLIPPSNFGPPHCFTDWTFLFTIITTNIVETLILNVIEFDYVLGRQIFLCKFRRVDLMIQVLVLEYKGILEFACSLQPPFFNEGVFSTCNEIVPLASQKGGCHQESTLLKPWPCQPPRPRDYMPLVKTIQSWCSLAAVQADKIPI